jgi:hypothetical protein
VVTRARQQGPRGDDDPVPPLPDVGVAPRSEAR